MRRLVPAAAAVLLTAACSSGAAHSAPASSAPSSAAPSSPAAASPSPVKAAASPSPAAKPAAAGSSVVRSTAGHGLPPGPFRIAAVKCGPYTAVEKAKFGTTAKGGLIFKYTNASNSLTDAVKLDVSFMAGTSVLGENVNGQAPAVAPGQSGEAAVDATGGSGTDLTFTTCELNTYSLLGSPAGGSFAP